MEKNNHRIIHWILFFALAVVVGVISIVFTKKRRSKGFSKYIYAKKEWKE